ncbi:hypothetical protein AVEN_6346-1 [Araneus ventricosus]|uniref:Uncharacterized protein n=1 Tax=Araneus ventricosus TaxID=182803 RepID=A0A4Y2PRS4_ARAVE|nr:hypothetical protein AVEN_6346-1 [Araneus ventricosus]
MDFKRGWIFKLSTAPCKFSSDFRIGERICMVWNDRECPALKDCSCDHRRAICVSLHAKVVCWYESDLQKGLSRILFDVGQFRTLWFGK